jgi:hypothetical protein
VNAISRSTSQELREYLALATARRPADKALHQAIRGELDRRQDLEDWLWEEQAVSCA